MQVRGQRSVLSISTIFCQESPVFSPVWCLWLQALTYLPRIQADSRANERNQSSRRPLAKRSGTVAHNAVSETYFPSHPLSLSAKVPAFGLRLPHRPQGKCSISRFLVFRCLLDSLRHGWPHPLPRPAVQRESHLRSPFPSPHRLCCSPSEPPD
jgi:hypothetical protein